MMLFEFPVTEIAVHLPKWVSALPENHKLYKNITACVCEKCGQVKALSDVRKYADGLEAIICEKILFENDTERAEVSIISSDLSKGKVDIKISLPDELYYKSICDLTGLSISDPAELINVLLELNDCKSELEKYKSAIEQLNYGGYGIVMPKMEDLRLEEPEVIKNAGAYGVRLSAKAESIHMIRADIETEINPIVGTEDQAEEIIQRLISEYEKDPASLWESNIFGKSLYELVNDGLRAKIDHLSEESREKLSETLSRIVNESSKGLICILL